MIHIYADGQELAIPADFTFQYCLENPFVTDSEGYSMTIEVPIKAGQNLAIFGFIYRLDTDITKIRFSALITTTAYTASGVLAVVGITATTVKLQFLQGRSADNFNARLDETYINELDLGTAGKSYICRDTPPEEALKSIDQGAVAVAMPWIITGSGEKIHNRIRKKSGTSELIWQLEGTSALTWMPYLLEITRRICSAAGFTYDLSAWEQSPCRHLLICNVIPESIGLKNFAYALPHWTISEYLENLEFILQGRFSIDLTTRHIKFTPWSASLQTAGTVQIEKVVNDYTATIDADPENADRPDYLRNRGYASNSAHTWPVRCADWYIRRRISEAVIPDEDYTPPATSRPYNSGNRVIGASGWYYSTMADTAKAYRNINRYDTMQELLQDTHKYIYSTNLPGFGGDALFYAADVNAFFCIYATKEVAYSDIPQAYRTQYALSTAGTYYLNALMPVNDFGDYLLDNTDSADRTELAAVPVETIQTDTEGIICSLPFTESDTATDDGIHQPKSYTLMMRGKQDRPEYYSLLLLGYWTGLRECYPEAGIYPLTSNIQIYRNWSYETAPEGTDLRLNNGLAYGSEEYAAIDYTKTYKIAFISDKVPDPQAIFLIEGKRYICRKLTAEFTTLGMSPTIQGEFMRIS